MSKYTKLPEGQQKTKKGLASELLTYIHSTERDSCNTHGRTSLFILLEELDVIFFGDLGLFHSPVISLGVPCRLSAAR